MSAVADPSTGVAVYDSYGSSGGANWYVFGGTSVSAPIIASVYALAHNDTNTDYPARLLYENPGGFFDAVGGNSKRGCGPPYLCHALAGFDGPPAWNAERPRRFFGDIAHAGLLLCVSPRAQR